MASVDIRLGDAIERLREIPDESVHAVITDPPYGLSNLQPSAIAHTIAQWNEGDRSLVPSGRGFMSRDWDAFVPPPAVWDEVMRVLVPGGHLAVFAGSRTVDIMGLSVRLAGFEMRDSLAAWLYSQGFPKSQDVSKAIDKAAGAEREIIGKSARHGGGIAGNGSSWEVSPDVPMITAPATDAARKWNGWGTALKPAFEPILLARKPFKSTVAANVLAHRAGALNVDACRVGMSDADREAARVPMGAGTSAVPGGTSGRRDGVVFEPATGGRWPTNVVLAHHPDCGPDEAPGPCVPGCQVAALDEQSGILHSHPGTARRDYDGGWFGDAGPRAGQVVTKADSGGASRFFPTFRYQAKAPKRERPMIEGKGWPTVKPLGLMQWLCRLLVAPGGLVVDPFCGSGATGEAARNEGFSSILIDADEFAIALTKERIYGDR